MTTPIVVGSASRDLTSADPRGWRLGGAVTYAGMTLARLGMRPRVLMGVDHVAASAEELDLLRAAGADVRLIRLRAGPVFENLESDGVRVQRCLEPGDPIAPHVPSAWGAAPAWFIGPVADELPADWAAVPPPGAVVVVGWQGLLRNLPRDGTVSRRAPSAAPLLERATIVGLSHRDVEADVGIDALAALLCPPATLLITAGAAGGTLTELLADGGRRTRRYPAVQAARVVDPTGAGDSFLAALLAARLRHPLAGSGRHGSALRFAAAVASLVVEEPGVLGVPTLAAVAARLRSSLNATS